MSVRQSLLAILDQGPCYGYQLRAEFDRRTGSTWPLNVGQIYNTLERLERDGLVERGDADDQGHVYWAITPAGSVEVSGWLSSTVERGTGTRDELAIKLAVAATLPGVDVTAVIQSQRKASLAQLQELQRTKYAGPQPDSPQELAWTLVIDNMIFQAEAEVRWLDHTEQRLAQHPRHALELELSTEHPKRGRPSARSLSAQATSGSADA
ncbi:PadR family transcriptional regulator [Microbacterium azadirachtae]|uniref:Transcriptional regulator PadR-like family protein n=1 Tax=Microbacterium azadirachtae TaxID=582680 RepID=A0A0F0LCZ5_9MICO|nr:PadR family transcriptional regulator [Microbacterium azadirachtae]KJL31013.1 Transcriptional regulator PadR-like family protein [Microbacterium azadirachtae]